MGREDFKVHVRFPRGLTLLGWSHPEGITLQVYRETGVNDPDDCGEIFCTHEYGLDRTTEEVWREAHSLVSTYLN